MESELKCTIERDRFGRMIYVPGDGVGVQGGGIMGKLSEKAIVPHTNLFHFLVIGDYIAEDDDYVILESIGKGTAVGRLSWYAGSRYTVFRMNDPNFAALGELAAERASIFGRRHYDYALYLKLAAWGLGYLVKELATMHFPPRPVRPDQIPYKTDRDFICIELYFAIWKLVGRRIRAHGQAPVPAEVILAVKRGTLAVIDYHNGNKSAWREPRGTIKPPSWATLGKAAEHIDRGDLVGLGTEKRVFYDGAKFNDLLCQVFGIESKNVYRILVDAKVGEIARVTAYEYVQTTGGDIDRLKTFVQHYEIKPLATPEPRPFEKGFQQREPSEEFEVAMNKRKHEPGPALTGRQGGQGRNRVHLYLQPYGYPIRACDWNAVDRESIEKAEEFSVPNPAAGTVVITLAARGGTGDRICKLCQEIAAGRRASMGSLNHGHGKGAPTP